MSKNLAAIARPVGKLDTDSGGLARYALKFDVPPGIGHGNEPELAIYYTQGLPNGTLGSGWYLGGLSSIRLGPARLAWDDTQTVPSTYDRFQSTLNLDGAELLNISGDYHATNTTYSTEIEHNGRVVTALETGFLMTDSLGRKCYYGTTQDSQVVNAVQNQVIEWRLKKQVDFHGNGVVFNYVVSPDSSSQSSDLNTSYLSNIRYTTHENTKHPGSRIVLFEYTSRDDKVVQTISGQKSVWAHLLSAVRFGVVRDEHCRLTRSYELEYSKSPTTGDSQLNTVTEVSGDGDSRFSLLPSTFGYTTGGKWGDNPFTAATKPIYLRETQDNVDLFPLNISGRALADIALIRSSGNSMSVKTYLAAPQLDGTITWVASTGKGSEAELPPINVSKLGMPNVLSPDLNRDGRPDLVVPYKGDDGFVKISVSQCIGTGFQDARSRSTNVLWEDNARFMALDISGSGQTDIIHIYPDSSNAGNLSLCNYPSYTDNDGTINLGSGTPLKTTYGYANTIDWVVVNMQQTGARSLVRIWTEDHGIDQIHVKATVFTVGRTSDTSIGFTEGRTSLLTKVEQTAPTVNVLAVDINGDGSQDIVLTTAEYKTGTFIFSFTTFLSSTYGGFELHGDIVRNQISAPGPLSQGKFHVTNLYGSNYPSISYVYQERDAKRYMSVGFEGGSDGLVRDPVLYTLTEDVLPDHTRMVPTDLTGKGMGEWLLYSIENDVPMTIPIYNDATIPDFLAHALDPMGLRTTVTYRPMTDPSVYEAAVDWKDYTNDSNDSHPVIAAPNYVVSMLEHQNESLISSTDFYVKINKKYKAARVNTMGRGWQGFLEIDTINVADQILTTEKYLQQFPYTGLKREVISKTLHGQAIKTDKISYEGPWQQVGPWKIYRTNETLEQTDMLDSSDTAVRSTGSTSIFDADGNVIAKAVFETQRGRVTYQNWSKFSYITQNGVKGLMTGHKSSSTAENRNMSVFEEGDSSLTLYEYDQKTNLVRSISEWTSNGDWAIKTYGFDQYGNQTRSVDAAGLTVSTFYDDVFHTFPVKITEQGEGVFLTQLAAFDEASGNCVAKWEPSGAITCSKLDLFGRVIEIRANAMQQGISTIAANQFLMDHPFVADPKLLTLLESTYLDPSRTLSYERRESLDGPAHQFVKTLSFSKDGANGQNVMIELLDCLGKHRKRSSRNGNDVDQSLQSWTYNSRGQQVWKSFPVKSSADIDLLDWIPDPEQGVRTTFDVLGRQTLVVRPAHREENGFIFNSTSYLDGGATVQECVLQANDSNSTLDSTVKLSQVQRRIIRVGQEDKIVESTDENGLTSIFHFDNDGDLIRATDPAGKVEDRTYNTKGSILTLRNVYQSTNSSGLTYHYNSADQLVQQTNALGETITYQNDAKGRILQKVGNDGKTIAYEYDTGGTDHLTAVTIYEGSPASPIESRFDFVYDHRGRIQQRRLTLGDDTSFTTTLSYDWQDNVVEKTLPDGVTVSHDYTGASLSTTILAGPPSTWSVKAQVTQKSAFDRPEELTVRGNGIQSSFSHAWRYDAQGFPLMHSLSSETGLVDQHYVYNNMDQISTQQDFIGGTMLNYTYAGRRLITSQLKEGLINRYSYDPSGNFIEKRGNTFTYTANSVSASGSMPFSVFYDGAGRMIQRNVDNESRTFKYDGFGTLCGYSDSSADTSTLILADFEGNSLEKKHSDGSSELWISSDFSIHTSSDGTRTTSHKLFHDEYLLASVQSTYESVDTTRPLGRKSDIFFTDTKKNVTHVFKDDASLRQQFHYDDFGFIDPAAGMAGADTTATYECNPYDSSTGLLDFGARLYDPLAGRFTTPDDILDVPSLLKTDGLNRYVFENNDPINNVDPTGHWSWSAIFGVVLSALAVVGAIALTVATGGAATLLGGAIIGAAFSGGIAGIAYSVKHKDEQDAGKFWGGFAATVGINAAIGAVTGAFAAYAAPLRFGVSTSFAAKASATFGEKMLVFAGDMALSGVASVLTNATNKWVENHFYGEKNDVWGTAVTDFFMGAATASLAQLAKVKRVQSFKSRAEKTFTTRVSTPILQRLYKLVNKVYDPHAPSSLWVQYTKSTLVETLLPGAKTGLAVVKADK